MKTSDPQAAALEEILAADSVTISANLAERALGIRRGRLADYARENPEVSAHSPHIPSGNRVKVIRVPFLRWLGCTEEEIKEKRLR